ncbi:Ppx/GppA phosphatase family protein [Streptomyces rimosus]|uniref:Ppx/GppA phosphatase family protein n=1 Tax=Streptomyces TaxID=1883 RepID=UPI000517BCA0|nr:MULTISPECIES: Ppx/GppA phosphatase family protein [Streptomyces]RSO32010.1 Ppx/GppA family phosphatase [Streptomyces sp. WAC 06725]
MRLAVLDAGSNSVHLLISEVAGGVPLPAHSLKDRVHLAEHVTRDGTVPPEGARRLAGAVARAREQAARWQCDRLFAYATAVVRDAANRDEVLATVHAESGMRLAVLPGEVEAELTFLAARRWTGLQAGPMALLDIGGGSLEIAFGRGARPDFAYSLPLGAGRLTREFLPGDGRPDREALRALRHYVRDSLKDVAARVRWEEPRTVVATSRTFQQLARLCGAAPGRDGPFVARHLARRDLKRAVRQLAALPPDERAALPGISAARRRQAPAGAVVAHQAMKAMGIDRVTVCPWALREGVLLRHLEHGSHDWWPGAVLRHGTSAARTRPGGGTASRLPHRPPPDRAPAG